MISAHETQLPFWNPPLHDSFSLPFLPLGGKVGNPAEECVRSQRKAEPPPYCSKWFLDPRSIMQTFFCTGINFLVCLTDFGKSPKTPRVWAARKKSQTKNLWISFVLGGFCEVQQRFFLSACLSFLNNIHSAVGLGSAQLPLIYFSFGEGKGTIITACHLLDNQSNRAGGQWLAIRTLFAM